MVVSVATDLWRTVLLPGAATRQWDRGKEYKERTLNECLYGHLSVVEHQWTSYGYPSALLPRRDFAGVSGRFKGF